MRVATTAGMALGLTVGGAAVAGAATSGTSTKHATHGAKRSAQGHVRPSVFGTVATVGANTFSVTTHEGSSVVVEVTSATTYHDHDVTSPSFANIKPGEMVAVFGTQTSGTVPATSVGIGTPGGRWKHGGGRGTRPSVFGTVATVGANTFSITTHEGSSVVVEVTSATTYRDRDVTSPSFANVKPGEMVAVFGTETSGTVAATSVGIGTPGGR